MSSASWIELIEALKREDILKSPSVIRAMRIVRRDRFLPESSKSFGAVDSPLPIGWGQTVSAPHMVSIMNEALELEVGHKVLEVGTGCGWHSATVAEIVAPGDAAKDKWGHVYTLEIVSELASQARKTLEDAGFGERVTVVKGDGSMGYTERAPYDRIFVTAAAPQVPPPLIEQLSIGGVLVLPLGSAYMFQTLMRFRRTPDGGVTKENLGGVAFVPLTGRYGHEFESTRY